MVSSTRGIPAERKKNPSAIVLAVAVFCLLAASASLLFIGSERTQERTSSESNSVMSKAELAELGPIHIDDQDPSRDWWWASLQPWCSGSGTAEDPYRIDQVHIDGAGSEYCILIENSNRFFVISRSTFENAQCGIKLIKVKNGTTENNLIKDISGQNGAQGSSGVNGGEGTEGLGISVEDGEGITLKDNGLYNISGGEGGNGHAAEPGGTDGGNGGRGCGINITLSEDVTIDNNSIESVRGGNGGTGGGSSCLGGVGGESHGISIDSSSHCDIRNNTIRNTSGGHGAAGNPYPELLGAYPGTGGDALGIELRDSCNITDQDNWIDLIIAGNGGTGGGVFTPATPGAAGGNACGILVNSSDTVYNSRNTVNNSIGGDGGSGNNDVRIRGGGTSYLIHISQSSRVYNSHNNLTLAVGGRGGEGTVALLSNGDNGGKGADALGIFIESSEKVYGDQNIIENITAGRGGKGGNGQGSSYKAGHGGSGGSAIGIFLQESSNCSSDNSQIHKIGAGDGGNGGSTYIGGNGGKGGNATLILLNASADSNFSSNDLSEAIFGTGGYGGTGGSGDGTDGANGTSYAAYISEGSQRNLFYGNYFYQEEVDDFGTLNRWDNGAMGNFWPSFKSLYDFDLDGIADYTYYQTGVKTVITDEYPLTDKQYDFITQVTFAYGDNASGHTNELEDLMYRDGKEYALEPEFVGDGFLLDVGFAFDLNTTLLARDFYNISLFCRLRTSELSEGDEITLYAYIGGDWAEVAGGSLVELDYVDLDNPTRFRIRADTAEEEVVYIDQLAFRIKHFPESEHQDYPQIRNVSVSEELLSGQSFEVSAEISFPTSAGIVKCAAFDETWSSGWLDMVEGASAWICTFEEYNFSTERCAVVIYASDASGAESFEDESVPTDALLPQEFYAFSDAGDPDADGRFSLEWTASLNADSYSIFYFESSTPSSVTEIEGATSPHLFQLAEGQYSLWVVAFNEYGNYTTDSLLIAVDLPYTDGAKNGEEEEEEDEEEEVPWWEALWLWLVGIVSALLGLLGLATIAKRARRRKACECAGEPDCECSV